MERLNTVATSSKFQLSNADGDPYLLNQDYWDTDRVLTSDRRRSDSILSSERLQKTADLPFDLDSDARVVLERVAPHPYDLTYACLMIPRFASHRLVGDVADNLYQWMQQICISFGWKLEFITVREDYLQWIMSVPAATPPSSFMKIIRQHSSQQIFDGFPRIKRENLGKDFWAPGYLVLVGSLPHPPEMINEFIRLTRQQQGLLPD
ncbi:MAG TPA: transposase [Anaerolineales bacterium]|nr:transposase [Anaerolineales bacterium]